MPEYFQLPLGPQQESKKENHLETRSMHEYSHCFWNNSFQENLPIYPAGSEVVTRTVPTWYKDHKCRCAMLVIATGGKVIYKSGDQTFPLCGNQVLFIPAGSSFYFETDTPPFYRKRVLFLLGINLSQILETLCLKKMELIPVPDVSAVEKKFQHIHRMLLRHRQSDLPELSARALEIIQLISAGKTAADPDMRMAQIIRSKLSADLENPLSVQQIADSLHISRRSLNRIFRENFEVSPEQYRLKCRMEKARSLLLQSSFSIKEISMQLGYCSQFYFSNEFKRIHDLSPLDFRRKRKS